MGNTIIYNGQEYGNPIVNDTGVGEYTSDEKKKNPTGSNNEIFNSYGGTYPNVIQDKTVDDVLITSTYSHAEGCRTLIDGASYAHAEGYNTAVSSDCGHAEGQNTIVSGLQSHAEGQSTTASGWAAHAEGASTQAIGANAHAEGNGTIASGDRSHAEGDSCIASGEEAHAEGQSCTASGINSHAQGYNTLAYDAYCHAEGFYTEARDTAAHAEGYRTIASGMYSHAQGSGTLASGAGANAEGLQTQATNSAAHAEGNETLASAAYAHAEGYKTIASSGSAHAEGNETKASQYASHAEGNKTQASGVNSHAEGWYSVASGDQSHAQNSGTAAKQANQTAMGKYNADSTNAALIIGNGSTSTAIISLYDVDEGYNVDDKIKIQIDNIWKVFECDEAIAEPAGSFDSTKWTDISDNYIIGNGGSTDLISRSNALTISWDGSIITGQQALINQSDTNILASGTGNTINGGCSYSVVEGEGNIIQFGSSYSHAEGYHNLVNSSSKSHIEGESNQITGGSGSSHIEGNNNIIANGSSNSHAEGGNNIITDNSSYSHIEGKDNIIGNAAQQCHVQNLGNVANSANQTIIGKYNQPNKNYAFIVGNGQGTSTTESGVGQYNQSSSYAQDSYCYYNGLVWKCLEAIASPAGTFNETEWEVQNAIYDSTTGTATLRASSNAMTVSWDGVLNVIGQNADIQINGTSVATGSGGDVANPNISDAYDSTATYAVGDYCIYNDNLYIATASTTGTFDSNDWTQTTATDNIKANTTSIASAAQSISNIMSMIAPTYNATSGTYSEGDYVIYNNNLYKCNTTISTAEDFDSSKWDSTTIMGAIKDIEIRLGGLSFYNGAATGTPDANTVYFIS